MSAEHGLDGHTGGDPHTIGGTRPITGDGRPDDCRAELHLIDAPGAVEP